MGEMLANLYAQTKLFLKNYNFAWKFKLYVCLPIFVVLVAIDWISKGVVVSSMQYNTTDDFIPNILSLHYIINPGAAYSMNSDNPTLAIALASIITFFLIFVVIFLNQRIFLVGVVLVFSGSFANLIARSWAPQTPDGVSGGVVDFLVWELPFVSANYIFNLADMWVSIGVAYIIAYLVIYLILMLVTFIKVKKGILIKDEDGNYVHTNKQEILDQDKSIPDKKENK